VGRSAEELLGLPIRVRGIELGRLVDVVVDPRGPRIVGFDVRCGDESNRFLPFAVAELTADAIELESPLVLLDFAQVDFYREQTKSLRELNGTRALVVASDGTMREPEAPRRR
jgi:sporulation protein YlmC with PRC-barrel domain